MAEQELKNLGGAIPRLIASFRSSLEMSFISFRGLETRKSTASLPT